MKSPDEYPSIVLADGYVKKGVYDEISFTECPGIGELQNQRTFYDWKITSDLLARQIVDILSKHGCDINSYQHIIEQTILSWPGK